jgi:hypothetical protein
MGKKVLRDQQQYNGGLPFIGGDRQANNEALARLSNNLFSRNIGSNKRRSDRPPRQRSACEKVVLGCFRLS